MREKSLKLLPGTETPELHCETVDQGEWTLSAQKESRLVAIVFYRGIHCPICENYIKTLDDLLPEFTKMAVQLVVVSGDTHERASSAKHRWDLRVLNVGYSISEQTMNAWGLYVSDGASDDEPAFFNEPGVFLVDPRQMQLKYVALSSGPWGLPKPKELLEVIEDVLEEGYAERGARYDSAMADASL